MNTSLISYSKYQSFIIYFLPISLATGPFLSDLIISITSFSFLIFCFFKKKFYYLKNNFFLIFFIWCIYLLVNSLLSTNIYNSLESSLFYIRFGIFSCCVYYLIIEHKNFLRYFTYALIITFIFVIIDAYFQYFLGYNILGFPYDGSRLGGITGSELVLGSFISRLFPLLFALTIYFFHTKKSLILIFLLLIITDVIIFLSGERTAFFNLFLFTFMLLILTSKKRIFRIISILISSTLIIFISFSDHSTKQRMIDLTFNEISGKNIMTIDPGGQVSKLSILGQKFYLFTKYHTAHFYTSSNIILDNKLFGVGPKNFRIVCDFQKYHSRFGCATHPHNTYLQLLSETGIIGSLPIIFLFIALSILFLNYLTINKFKIFNRDNEYLTCLLICVYISLWPLVPSGNFFNNWLSGVYFLPIGFILAEINKNNLIYR
jgi:O-antigen ligase